MAFQSVPNVAEVDVIFTLNGVTVQNVFYGLFPAGYALSDLQDLADRVDLRLTAHWRPEQPPEVSYIRTEVRGLTSENDLSASQDLSAYVGVALSSSLPNNVTFAIKKESGLTGRSARGRLFWIGIPRDEIQLSDENLLKVAYAALLVENVDEIRDGIADLVGWSPVLVSRFTGGVKRPFGVTFPWLTTTNVDLRVDTHRNRLPN